MAEINQGVPWQPLLDLIEVATIRHFAGIDLISDKIPDGKTIPSFSHWLENNNFGKDLNQIVVGYPPLLPSTRPHEGVCNSCPYHSGPD